jgi:hypothetical protein
MIGKSTEKIIEFLRATKQGVLPHWKLTVVCRKIKVFALGLGSPL